MADEHGLTLTDGELYEIAKEAALYMSDNEQLPTPKEPRPFKRGDKVYDDKFGRGIIEFTKKYLSVRLDNDYVAYTPEGILYSSIPGKNTVVTLFHTD